MCTARSAVVGEQVIIGGCDGAVHVVELTKGQLVRKFNVGPYVGSAVAVVGDVAYLGHFGNRVAAFQMQTGERLWETADTGFPYLSSPAVSGSLVVIEGGTVRCMLLIARAAKNSGFFRRSGGSIARWSPLVTSSCLGLTTDACTKLHRKTAHCVGPSTWVLRLQGTPAAVGREMFVGTHDGTVYAFEAGVKP